MLAIQRSARSSFTTAYSMIRFSPSRVDAGNGARSIQSGMCDGAFFWKKFLPCQPSG